MDDPVRDPWLPAMRLALAEAARTRETADVPVGAVVLGPDGSVLSRGRNRREATGDPTAHAEVVALREASHALRRTRASDQNALDWRLTGCTLVVTLEPCTMCAGASVLARVDRIVYGARDPKAGATGSLWDVVRDRRLNHRPEVVAGVLPQECGTLLTDFFRTASRTALRRPGKPSTAPTKPFGSPEEPASSPAEPPGSQAGLSPEG